MNAHQRSACLLSAALLSSGLGCASTPTEPQTPTWADVAPIFRGECNGCHGWNAPVTGSGERFDFFDVDVCGDAALAVAPACTLETLRKKQCAPNVLFAGSPLASSAIEMDVVPQGGAAWPHMPPQPSPALPGWEVGALERWAATPPGTPPVKGPAPPNNRPPTISVEAYPAIASAQLAFTAILDDPDDDAAIGVIEVNGLGFLMNRTGSFTVNFDSSTWPAGSQDVTAVLCDGWTAKTIDLGAVQIKH
jgi:hypothetical protein